MALQIIIQIIDHAMTKRYPVATNLLNYIFYLLSCYYYALIIT